MRFLDRFSVVLLDMNGTFMFEVDRFGPGEDFHATYRSMGGDALDGHAVESIIHSACEILVRDYNDPARVDDFPSLDEALRRTGRAPEQELGTLERVFAAHELGKAPENHVSFLRQLAKSHALGVVSNICTPPELCRASLEAAGLGDVFNHTHFSSQGRSIKPSPAIFRRALASFPADSRVLFVGDSLERDIRPARLLGMATAWIAPRGSEAPEADVVIESLPELALVAMP